MPNMTRRTLLGASISIPLSAALAQSSGWPQRPVRIMLGYSSGGATDAVARALEPGMQAFLGQPTVIDYKPGAGATVAAAITARAAPDGYLIHLTDSGPMTTIPNGKKLDYGPDSFAPIGMVCENCYVVAVNSGLPVENLADLVKLSKSRPNGLSYGSPGVGGVGHLAAELLRSVTGAELTHVPYKGGGPAMTDLVGGHLPMTMASPANALPFAQAGKIRVLAVTSARRSSVFPDVPTVAELGYPGFDAAIWFAMVGPAGVPVEIAAKLNQALSSSLSDPGVQATLRKLGFEPTPSTPDVVMARIRSDLEKWGKVIKDRGIVFA